MISNIEQAVSLVASECKISSKLILKHYQYPMDGYDLAKELDHHEFIDICADDVACLNKLNQYIDDLKKRKDH